MNNTNMQPDVVQADVLVLGIGNLLMSDEGVGVHAIQQFETMELPEGVQCLDGGTGGFHLLDAMHRARSIILIDATIDGNPVGTVSRLEPRFSSEYPRTLTAHDIGLKDLLDTYYLLGRHRDIVLFAVSIAPDQEIGTELSPEIRDFIAPLCELVRHEIVHCLTLKLACAVAY